jgi:dTDP-glucose 4,6-dehydratase
MIEQNKIEAPDDKILQEDLEYLVDSPDFSGFFNTSVLVTGATGLIGSQLVKLFLSLNRIKNANIKIFAFIRDDKKARRIFNSLYERINFIVGDIKVIPQVDGNIDFIIHGASETSSVTFIEKPVETIDTAYTGTKNMLELAKNKKVKGFVYLSSMEVFGITDFDKRKENDYGYIDILSPRSSYSESKRMCECLCACFTKEYNTPVKIARLAQVVGAGIDYCDTRAPAQFARSVIENKDIILRTEGKTRRPCIYTRDALTGVCTVLLKGNDGEAYNIANTDTTITIKETVEMIVNKIAENNIKIIYKIDNNAGYAPDFNLDLNIEKINSLDWGAEIGLVESYKRMIESMRERNKYIV